MKTAAFVHGWSEGPWQSRKFKKELEQMGLRIVKPSLADIIVAHSSGCYLISKKNKARLIVLIGPPHWPGRTLLRSVFKNIRIGIQNHKRGTNLGWWFNKISHNLWYIFTRPLSSYHALTKCQPDNLPNVTSKRIILVRNINDTFCHPDIQQMIPKTNGYKFTQMPGDHEHCWLKPEAYIELIKKELYFLT